jgi:hypothetical protein
MLLSINNLSGSCYPLRMKRDANEYERCPLGQRDLADWRTRQPSGGAASQICPLQIR